MTRIERGLAAACASALLCHGATAAADGAKPAGETMRISIAIEGAVVTAALEDNETARDFVSLLPMTLTLEDYAATEKIADLPKALRTGDAPAGIDPAAGDIAYYAPWGNLAIFYEDFGYSRGLVKIGTIESGLEIVGRAGAVQATIELLE